MELLLKDGDYVPDGKGGVRRAEGTDELLQRVLFLLTARRGGFPFLPQLGSRLYLLTREKSGARTALARQYAAEALAEMRDIEVTGVELSEREDEKLDLMVHLDWRGKQLTAQVRL